MELKSMKIIGQPEESYGMPLDKPEYPYSLKIRLEDDILSKLGLMALPAVGQSLLLYAKVEVCEVSQYDSQDGGKKNCVGLQITDMSLGKFVSSDKQVESGLYNGE